MFDEFFKSLKKQTLFLYNGTPSFFKIYWHEEGSSSSMRCTRVTANSFDEATEGFLASKKQPLITIVAITREEQQP